MKHPEKIPIDIHTIFKNPLFFNRKQYFSCWLVSCNKYYRKEKFVQKTIRLPA